MPTRIRRASIDLGTNTCLLLVADVEVSEKFCEVASVAGDFATVVRLGQGVDRSRELHPDAIDRTLKCLRDYAQKAKALGVEPSSVLCVATSQARDAKNGAEFFARVERETDFRFRIISGDDEAKFTFLGGLLPGMKAGASAVIDIGGGSTEIIASRGGQSIDVGSVRFTERYLKSDPVTDEEFWNCQAAIDAALEPLRKWRSQIAPETQLVAVAGTATTLAAWHLGQTHFEAAALNALTLTRGDLHRLVEELKWRNVAERAQLPGVEPGRADVLLAGAMILWRSLEILDFPDCRISTQGLRFGVLLNQ